MRRITHIKFYKYRAFHGEYHLSFPKGENVLIYGENGSGKSSVYNALKDFFASSENPALPFWRNVYAEVPVNDPFDGTVEVTFHNQPILDTDKGTTYNFSAIPSIRDAQAEIFIKKANKAKAFLSYKELVQSYLVPKDDLQNPDLYELFIEGILGEFVLPSGITINERWKQIYKDFSIRDGRIKKFKKAVNDIPIFAKEILDILKPILVQLNDFLSNYFNNHIAIDINQFILRTLKQNNKLWQIDKVFRLESILFNDKINNGYHNHINEARLSAVAICLYLAAIKKSPQPDDYKLIFLDDIFIGLDTSNRLPLLELLKAEFSTHQIFISTYDRFWYETAIRWFKVQMKDQWKCYEIFVHEGEHITGKTFDKPILTEYNSNFAKGQTALKNEVKPDYPCAANNFRKYAEELLTDKNLIPEQENRNQFATDKDYYGELTLAYKLTQIVDNAIRFVRTIHQNDSLLVELKSHLNTLLHPLSHFELASPIYKGELLRIESCLIKLGPFLEQIKNNYKPVTVPLKKMRLNFTVSPTIIRRYSILTIPQLYIVHNNGNLQFSDCECYTPNVLTETIGNQSVNHKCDYKQNSTSFKFSSISNAYKTLRDADISQPQFSTIAVIPDFLDAFEYSDDGNIWIPLKNLMTW
jgi:energy-coupling factor transporter ATP-binding protein EcfA2